jgi:hypothetical protein
VYERIADGSEFDFAGGGMPLLWVDRSYPLFSAIKFSAVHDGGVYISSEMETYLTLKAKFTNLWTKCVTETKGNK